MTASKRVPAESHPPNMWTPSNRLIQPYRIGYKITVAESISPIPDEYLIDPIHPWLLRLVPGDSDSFHDFIAAVGIYEFLDWAYEVPLPPWTHITEALDATGNMPSNESVRNPWADDETIRAVTQQQSVLRNAYTAATDAKSLDEAITRVLETGWDEKHFRIELARDPSTRTIFERPADLWARGWFELLDGLDHGLPPKACLYCTTPFTPNRSNQRYCLGNRCNERQYERKRSRTRTEYHKAYQRKRRAKQRRNQAEK
jgi:hypothetical protein